MTDQNAIDAAKARPASIDDLPGDYGPPVFGHTFALLRDPVGHVRQMHGKYGRIYRTRSFFQKSVMILGPEANELFFMDRGRQLSSRKGWNLLRELFPGGLMLRDFDDHKVHRKIMAVAFKTPAMRRYMDVLNQGIPERIANWSRRGRFKFYDAIKELTLEMAQRVFLGLEPGPETRRVNDSLTAMVNASIAVLRLPIPGTLYQKGLAGRRYMIDYLSQEIPKRRGQDGADMLTLLCNATDDEGNAFTDQEVIDHMNFLWMAAHDTITSSVSTLVYELGRHPEWQERLRDEVLALGLNGADLPYDRMGDLPLTEAAFKEALRINAPVPSIPRRTLEDIEFAGHIIPADTPVIVDPVFTHHMPELWDDPEAFDPIRFTAEGGVKERHRFAWVPFGGGAHMCIGLHFAYMQMKVIMTRLLSDYRIELDPGYATEFQIMPLTKPKDGLPLRIVPRS